MTINRLYQFGTNELVAAAYLLEEDQATRELLGMLLPLITGGASFWPALNGVLATPGGGLIVNFGGGVQCVVLQNFLVREIPLISYSVPANTSGQVRIDLICGQPAPLPVASYTGSQRDPGTGNITSATFFRTSEGINAQYVPGTPGGGAPAVPLGYTAIYQITVPSGLATVTSANITLLLSTVGQLLALLTPTRQSSVSGVPVDGSAVFAINFVTPFSTVTNQIFTSVEMTSRTGTFRLSTPQISAKTVNGFSVYIGGADLGVTGTVHYTAYGQ